MPTAESVGPELDQTRDATQPESARAESLASGTIIGRYVVLSKLGAGAMGVVLAAYDPELDRRVALKLLKPRPGSWEAARSRLQREAQALAKLDHHNVVGVYDVGVHAGQLFVGMEFVQGQTLGEWMASVDEPRAWQEVLGVFTEAGRGLSAAHEAGLVHRDFKPDNVMLGEDGRVRVMDFGLVRSDDDEAEAVDAPLESSLEQVMHNTGKQQLGGLTQTGTMMGTPAYMSLEQFEAQEADARSDQFSFCVALYEALYGERPFAGSTLAELMRAVEHGRLRPPAKGTRVPAWLRKVVVRGLAVERDERWPSMAALLGALADDPAVRRRKWWSAAVVLGLLGGMGGGLWHVVRLDAQTCMGMEAKLDGVWDAAGRAEVQAAIEGTQLSYAGQTWARVEQRVDAYTQQWVEARVEACEATQRGEQSGELLDLRMACLDDRMQHVRAIVGVLAAADETVVREAVKAVAELPRLERCADVDALTAGIAPPEDPEVAARVEALDEQLIEAQALEKAGKYEDSMAMAEAVEAEAQELGYEPLLVRAWLRRGRLQERAGDYEGAEATLERAYEAAVGLRMAAEAARASSDLMYVVGYELARHEEGRRWAKDAKPLSRAAGGDEARALYLFNLGVVADAEGNYEQARADYEQALALWKKALGPDHPYVASSLGNLGNVAGSEGNYEQARAYHEQALSIREKTQGPDHPDVAAFLLNLGGVADSEGNYEQARAYNERALAIWEKALGPDHPYVAAVIANLGDVANSEGKYEQARADFERARAIWERALGPDHPEVAYPLTGLGRALLGQSKPGEALTHLERALRIRTSNEGDPTGLAEIRFVLARALWDAPVDMGGDRSRATSLAELARDAYAEAGEKSAKDLDEVQTWQQTRARMDADNE